MVKILYGIEGSYKDISEYVLQHCVFQGKICIPSDDNLRAFIFGDPCYGKVKHILIQLDDERTLFYSEKQPVRYSLSDTISIQSKKRESKSSFEGKEPIDKIREIHAKLHFVDGSLQDEWNEQVMVATYLKPNAKVLELGSNIGRNTVMISSLLEDDKNLVTLECDPVSVYSLWKNRFVNKMSFEIEPSALSYRKLIQKGWVTIPSDVLLEGYKEVKTITFEEIEDKYQIKFDTLIADCEGALYYILKDSEAIMQNLHTVILESDFFYAEHKKYVIDIFTKYGLTCVHSEPLSGHPDYIMNKFPKECRESFYEVWQKE
jgi:hypothetical protein